MTQTTTPQPAGSLPIALQHATRLLAAHPQLALEQAEEILKAVPLHPAAILVPDAGVREAA